MSSQQQNIQKSQPPPIIPGRFNNFTFTNEQKTVFKVDNCDYEFEILSDGGWKDEWGRQFNQDGEYVEEEKQIEDLNVFEEEFESDIEKYVSSEEEDKEQLPNPDRFNNYKSIELTDGTKGFYIIENNVKKLYFFDVDGGWYYIFQRIFIWNIREDEYGNYYDKDGNPHLSDIEMIFRQEQHDSASCQQQIQKVEDLPKFQEITDYDQKIDQYKIENLETIKKYYKEKEELVCIKLEKIPDLGKDYKEKIKEFIQSQNKAAIIILENIYYDQQNKQYFMQFKKVSVKNLIEKCKDIKFNNEIVPLLVLTPEQSVPYKKIFENQISNQKS